MVQNRNGKHHCCSIYMIQTASQSTVGRLGSKLYCFRLAGLMKLVYLFLRLLSNVLPFSIQFRSLLTYFNKTKAIHQKLEMQDTVLEVSTRFQFKIVTKLNSNRLGGCDIIQQIFLKASGFPLFLKKKKKFSLIDIHLLEIHRNGTSTPEYSSTPEITMVRFTSCKRHSRVSYHHPHLLKYKAQSALFLGTL